jgi:hypothetical protein
MIGKYEFEKLGHDLKRIGKTIGLLKEMKQKQARDKLIDLLTDELDRLYSDLEELKANGNGGE